MAVLFSDNFEDGTLNAWDVIGTDGGKLAVTTGAALHGTYGVRILIDNTNDKYLRDLTPNDKVYRFRFYFDPNGVSMAANDRFFICKGAVNRVTVHFEYTVANNYTLIAEIRDDGTGYTKIYAYNVSDAPHCVEVYWLAATAAGANNGFMQFWVDGVSIGTVANVDNDTRIIDQVELCAMSIDAGTTGTIYLDDFVSNNDGSEIGLISTGWPHKWNGVTISKLNGAVISKWNGIA